MTFHEDEEYITFGELVQSEIDNRVMARFCDTHGIPQHIRNKVAEEILEEPQRFVQWYSNGYEWVTQAQKRLLELKQQEGL